LAEFLVKRGGVRTNWKCRYFLLTGDHLHYFEPQIVSFQKERKKGRKKEMKRKNQKQS